jgi:hypothetical protein
MEEQLPAGLSEGQIAEFVENGEVLAGEVIGDSSLPPCACFGLQAIDEITVLKKWPRRPARMQLRAMAIARCVLLPVPVVTAP